MVLINPMRRYSLRCWVYLQLFQSDIVLECIFIPAISILKFLRQVLIFFYFAAPLISFLWKIVIETELGKRIASLNCRLIIHHSGSFNPDTESNTNLAFSHFSIVVLNTTIFRRTRSRHRPQNSQIVHDNVINHVTIKKLLQWVLRIHVKVRYSPFAPSSKHYYNDSWKEAAKTQCRTRACGNSILVETSVLTFETVPKFLPRYNTSKSDLGLTSPALTASADPVTTTALNLN